MEVFKPDIVDSDLAARISVLTDLESDVGQTCSSYYKKYHQTRYKLVY